MDKHCTGLERLYILKVKTAQAKLKISEDNLTSLMSDRNATIVTEQLSQLSAPDGSINHGGLWKVKKEFSHALLTHPWLKKIVGVI